MLAFDTTVPAQVRVRVSIVLAAAIMAISSSAVLVRGMEADSAAIAAWRCTLAAMVLSPSLAGSLSTLSRPMLLRIGLGGTCLGLHFVSWFASLEYTTVMRSTLLVCLTPVWAGLVEWLWLKTPPKSRFFLGVAVAIVGVVLLGLLGGDGSAETGLDTRYQLLGDGLAVLGGWFSAAYMLIGRQVRQQVGVMPYMCLVCAMAALTAWTYALSVGAGMWGYPPATWMLLMGAVFGPQLIGHQGLSYAVRYVPASAVSSLVLLEPLGATLLAGLFLAEWPGLASAGAGLVVLAGVVVAARE